MLGASIAANGPRGGGQINRHGSIIGALFTVEARQTSDARIAQKHFGVFPL